MPRTDITDLRRINEALQESVRLREEVERIARHDLKTPLNSIVAAARLLAKRAGALARISQPRERRQKAYALLARNGFDPEVCRTVAASVAPPAGRP